MIKYTFTLNIKSSDQNYICDLDLTPNQEDNPEQIFTPKIREEIRINLQNQSYCKINDGHLNQIIKTWIEDIEEGYRNSNISLDLPSLMVENIKNLQESGNQAIPDLLPPDLSNVEPSFGMLPPLTFF